MLPYKKGKLRFDIWLFCRFPGFLFAHLHWKFDGLTYKLTNFPSLAGEGLMMLQCELKHQRKIARSLKKKSLWTKSLEEVLWPKIVLISFLKNAFLTYLDFIHFWKNQNIKTHYKRGIFQIYCGYWLSSCRRQALPVI